MNILSVLTSHIPSILLYEYMIEMALISQKAEHNFIGVIEKFGHKASCYVAGVGDGGREIH